jgi:hypothetical protein
LTKIGYFIDNPDRTWYVLIDFGGCKEFIHDSNNILPPTAFSLAPLEARKGQWRQLKPSDPRSGEDLVCMSRRDSIG